MPRLLARRPTLACSGRAPRAGEEKSRWATMGRLAQFEDLGEQGGAMKPTAVSILLLGLMIVVPKESAVADEPAFSEAQICKAGISLVMGRDPSIIKTKVVGDEVKVSYVRSDDGSVWKYKCKLEGPRVLWGADPGRWRNHPADEPMFYSVRGEGESARLTVEERYQDGSSRTKTFNVADLK